MRKKTRQRILPQLMGREKTQMQSSCSGSATRKVHYTPAHPMPVPASLPEGAPPAGRTAHCGW